MLIVIGYNIYNIFFVIQLFFQYDTKIYTYHATDISNLRLSPPLFPFINNKKNKKHRNNRDKRYEQRLPLSSTTTPEGRLSRKDIQRKIKERKERRGRSRSRSSRSSS